MKVLTVVCVKINDNVQISDLFPSYLSLFLFCSTSCGSTHYAKSMGVPRGWASTYPFLHASTLNWNILGWGN